MPVVSLRGGMELEIPDKREIREITKEEASAAVRSEAQAYNWMRLPETLKGIVASSAISLGVSNGQVLGPEQGYAWTMRRLIVNGLAGGATPDVVNLYLNDRLSAVWWQFNGNNFGYTFGRSELVMMPGDTVSMRNSGNLAATGVILLSGELEEVPAEMLYKVR
jgi:hypothetical protein